MDLSHKEQSDHLKAAWDKYDRGDHLTDEELRMLIKSADQGADYLSARGEWLARAKTLTDLESLRGYLRARNLKA